MAGKKKKNLNKLNLRYALFCNTVVLCQLSRYKIMRPNPLCCEWLYLPWLVAPLIRLNCSSVCCLFLQESAGEIYVLSPTQRNRIGLVLRLDATPKKHFAQKQQTRRRWWRFQLKSTDLLIKWQNLLRTHLYFMFQSCSECWYGQMEIVFDDFHLSLCITCDKSVSEAERRKGGESSDAVSRM